VTPDWVFLLDVDNTLLDSDRVIADLKRHLKDEFGTASADCYWAAFESLRTELGYADYLGALQRYRADIESSSAQAQRLLHMSGFLIDYPFADRLYPGALDVITRLARFGPTVILTDGDVVFQPRKVKRSGLWDAVDGRVLIYVHKEQQLAAVQDQYPARRYVIIDDKLRLLTAIKQFWGERVVTVFPHQGHYAFDSAANTAYPPADHAIEHIGDLNHLDISHWLDVAGAPTHNSRQDIS